MNATFETILNQAQTLTSVEREKLIESLKKATKNHETDKKREKIREFRGKYRHILPSTEEFLTEKQKELELENN